MKNYYIKAEIEEISPDYTFVVRAKTFKEAEKIAEKELEENYADAYHFYGGIDFSCCEITAEGLLARLTIN
jgi:DNA polymerase III sliding clamp (beta) subunit (PCNA family)